MENQFIPYEQALELAKLNFNEKCFGHYGVENKLHIEISCNLDSNLTRRNFIAVPTYQQAFRWFREKYGLDGHVTFRESTTNKIEGINSVYYNIEIYTLMSGDAYKTYNFKEISNKKEEAELACLIFLIEMVKNK